MQVIYLGLIPRSSDVRMGVEQEGGEEAINGHILEHILALVDLS